MNTASEWQGFWSYVHRDDEAEGGRITQLARDVASQFEMMSGESISLFLDQDAIEWGHDWKGRIDESLGSVAFFIAVLTPRYFMSAECRRELQFFLRKATALGIGDLVLPLHYTDVRQLGAQNDADELIKLVQTFQWEDWRELRFSARESEQYRRGVVKLAGRLVEANWRETARMGKKSALASEQNVANLDGDDSPGMLDLLGTAEEALPKVTETLDVIATNIQNVGQVMNKGTEEIRQGDSHGKGFAARLLVAQRLVQRLKEPVEAIETSANAYASLLHDVDQGFRILIEQAPKSIEADSESKGDVCALFSSLRYMSTNAHTAFSSVKGMIESIEPIEKMSRDLRPTLRRLRQALTVMIEGTEVIDDWVSLIDASGVECESLGDRV